MLISYILFRYGVADSDDYIKTTHMKWNMLKRLYRVNPKAWMYRKVYVNSIYRRSFTKVLMYRLDNGDKVRVHLSYFGYIAFVFAKTFGHSKYNEGMQLILDDIQRDIDKLREEAQRQIDSARKQITLKMEVKNNG